MTRIDVGGGISVYVHLPFCLKKCNYCGFYSEGSRGRNPEEGLKNNELIDDYIDALLHEAEMCATQLSDRKLVSVYFGGGTPTVLSERQLSRLTEGLATKLGLFNGGPHDASLGFNGKGSTEFAIEANPESITRSKARLLRNLGFNRISLGAQSFNDDTLKMLGRVHTAKKTIEAYADCRSAGFSNINLDLMFGYAGQSVSDLMIDLEEIVKLDPEHISLYALSVDSDSMWANDKNQGHSKESDQGHEPFLLDPDSTADLYDIARRYLKSRGFLQYEISNFSKKGFRSRHNEGYWTRREYLGLGASAASLFQDKRKVNVADTREYIRMNKSELATNSHSLTPGEILEEVMFLGLRRLSGISKSQAKRYDLHEHFAREIEEMRALGMIVGGEDIRLSSKALFVSNEVLCRFID